MRQIAGSHNWIRGIVHQRAARRLVEHRREGQLHERDRRARSSSRPPGSSACRGAPVTGGFPHFEFADGSFISTGGVKPFDILSRVVQGTDTVTWLAGRHTLKAGVDIQYVEYRDQISFFDGEELGRYVFDGTSPATRSPTSCSGCRTSPATSCRRPT